MRFSKTELKVLEQLALGKKQVLEVARVLSKDKSQVYRIIKTLEQKGFLSLKNKEIKPSEGKSKEGKKDTLTNNYGRGK